jgi:hypothetical protein
VLIEDEYPEVKSRHTGLMPTPTLSPAIIIAAITGFESQKTRIDAQIAELRAMLDGGSLEPAAAPEVPRGKRRKISAAGRKRMAEGQRKRWAQSPSSPIAPEPAKPKRKLSAAGKAAIVAALKKRWAAKKAAAKAAPVKTAAKTAAAKKPQTKAAKST